MPDRPPQDDTALPRRAGTRKSFEYLDAHQAPPQAPKRPANPSPRTWIGLFALFAVGLLLVLPLDSFRKARQARHAPRVPSASPSATAHEALDSLKLAASLASAARALADIEALKREGGVRSRGAPSLGDSAPESPASPRKAESPKAPSALGSPASLPDEPFPDGQPPAKAPVAASFPNPTACVASYLPDVELPLGQLDFVCTEQHLWTIEGLAQPRLRHLDNRGAEIWRDLGPYVMTALATMRAGCCPDAEPILAVLPTHNCGTMTDRVRAIGAMPDRASFASVHEILECLANRQVHLPAHFAEPSEGERNAALHAFVRHAWARAAP